METKLFVFRLLFSFELCQGRLVFMKQISDLVAVEVRRGGYILSLLSHLENLRPCLLFL